MQSEPRTHGSAPMFNLVLDQQKAMLDESLKMWSRLFSVPAGRRAGPRRPGRHHARRRRLRGGLAHACCTTAARPAPRTPSPSCSATPWSTARTSSTCSPTRASSASSCTRGFDVYLIDWGIPSAADRSMRLHDYVCGLHEELSSTFVCRERGSPKLNLLGYCMGGTMSAMFTALYPELDQDLTLLAAPIDFSRRRQSLLHALDRARSTSTSTR